MKMGNEKKQFIAYFISTPAIHRFKKVELLLNNDVRLLKYSYLRILINTSHIGS